MEVPLDPVTRRTFGRILVKALALVALAALFALWYVLAFSLPVYHYESSDRGWDEIEVPWKGRHLETVEALFEGYRAERGDPDLVLCRTSRRSWWSPNLWWDNLTHRRWALPYIEPSPEPPRAVAAPPSLEGEGDDGR